MSIKMITRVSAVAAAAVCALAFSTPANAATGYKTLLNGRSVKCLAVPHASKANGTGLIQWECSGDSEQQWALQPVEGGNGDRFLVRNLNSDKCLAIPNGTTVNGTQAIQWECSGGPEQLWIYDSIQRLRNVKSDRCLAIPGSSTANGAEAIQWTCSLNADQLWRW
ncbi:RICIN domain-containing protein [Streptomyces sp. NPDC059862]|uniref:RICIN domain-containing protein n=1 Tax=unclassified Streptomyces TaxID=2593676 RepID=UPI00362FE9C2